MDIIEVYFLNDRFSGECLFLGGLCYRYEPWGQYSGSTQDIWFLVGATEARRTRRRR